MKTRLLVIENKDNHQKDAKKCLETQFKDVVADFATTYKDALQMLKKSTYDGVLSDVFLPNMGEKKDIDHVVSCLKDGEGFVGRKFTLKIYEDLFKNELPYGILIGSYALNKNLPIVLITDTYHHGKKTEPVNGWSKSKQVPMVDRDVNEESCKEEGLDYRNDNEKAQQHEFSKKDWTKGFFNILWMITGKKIVDISAKGIQTKIPFGWYSSFLNCMKKKDWSSYSSQQEERESFIKTAKLYLKH